MQADHISSQADLNNLLDHYTEEALIEFLKVRIGMRVQDHQMNTLRQTAAEASSRFGYENINQLVQTLKSQTSLSPEMEFMIAGLTVGESYFFRDSRQFAYLENEFLPALIRRRREQNNHTLRVWSAGCSDGQEIASIAMLVRQQLPDIDDWNLHFLGTDINSEALARATKGEYRQWSMRAMPDAVLNECFTKHNLTYTLKPEVRKYIKYAWLNLTEDRYPSILTETSALDLIICRNVFIYLDDHVVKEILKRFEACLAINGTLMLGAADPNEIATNRMRVQESNGAFYYKRRDTRVAESQASVARAPNKPPKRQKQLSRLKTFAPDKKQDMIDSFLVDAKSSIRKLEAGNQWDGLLDIVHDCFQNGIIDQAILRSQAMALANTGRLNEAEKTLKNLLQQDPEDYRAHFINALVLSESEDTAGAIHALRRALYVERGFIEAHRQMGLMLIHKKHYKRGLRELQTALELAIKEDPAKELEFMTGVNIKRFVNILESEINMYVQLQRNG